MRRPLWQRAASLAARSHDHQYRDDDKTPYFSHPARVAMTVAQLFGCDDEIAIAAAYLHDIIENSDREFDDIAEACNTEVAEMVAALTKNCSLPPKQRDSDYSDRLRKADWRARLVKLADELDNYSDTLDGVKEGNGEERAKARTFLELAKPDAEKHPETRRAIKALKKAISKKA